MVNATSAERIISTSSMKSGSEWTDCLMVISESPEATRVISFVMDLSLSDPGLRFVRTVSLSGRTFPS